MERTCLYLSPHTGSCSPLDSHLQSRPPRIMSLDIELFIEAIKLHPALYDKKVKEYADKNLKKKLWCELCTQFVEKWNKLCDKEKKEKSKQNFYLLHCILIVS